MTYEPDVHHRRSIRLQQYDYSKAGSYFLTICAKNWKCLFGKIVGDEVILNAAGRMIQMVWNEMPEHYFDIETDEFVIMPNHIHGIISIVGAGPCACPDIGQPQGVAPTIDRPQGVAPTIDRPQGVALTGETTGLARRDSDTLSLPDVVHRFKSMTTKQYIDGVKQHGWGRFSGKLWQRNYYEHIIRNESELNQIREYISNNPRKWDLDRENPDNHC